MSAPETPEFIFTLSVALIPEDLEAIKRLVAWSEAEAIASERERIRLAVEGLSDLSISGAHGVIVAREAVLRIIADSAS